MSVEPPGGVCGVARTSTPEGDIAIGGGGLVLGLNMALKRWSGHTGYEGKWGGGGEGAWRLEREGEGRGIGVLCGGRGVAKERERK